MALAAQAILAVGIDDGVRGGQFLAHLVVVDDDNVDAALCRHFKRLKACRAAVHRDDQAGPIVDERGDGLGVRPVAFGDAVRNIDARGKPMPSQEAVEQGG